MRIGIDFDRVLFDTDGFKRELEQKFPEFSETYSQARKDDYYNLEKHAEIMGVKEEKLLEEMRECSKYLFDTAKLEKLSENHEIVIVTRGQQVIQKEKMENSGILEKDFVDDYIILQEKSKDSANIDFLVDDWERELERADVPGILFEEEDSLEKIVAHLETPDFEEVFKRYDIRGRYPFELNEYFAYRLGRSIAEFCRQEGREKVVVSKDTKDSSSRLKESLVQGLENSGIKVFDAGTGPTDYTALSAKEKEGFGIQVTSSHLPLDFNGFKLLYPEGNGFVNEDLDRIEKFFREERFEDGEGERKNISAEMQKEYRKKLEKFIERFDTSFEKKVVVDTLGGASETLPEILEELGAEVIDLSRGKDETPYRDPPNPKPEMLDELKQKVEDEEADIGIANDMDGDRVTVYRKGKFLSGDELFAVFSQLVEGDIVASIDTSQAVEDVVERRGNNIIYTRVGDPFVMDKALEENVKLAGEPNGHYAFPDFVPYNSGTLSALIAAGIDLDRYLEKVPDYHRLEKSIEVEDKQGKMEKVKEKTRSEFKILSEIDGVKFRSLGATALIRSSGSSEKLRVKVESEHPKKAGEVMSGIEDIIRNA